MLSPICDGKHSCAYVVDTTIYVNFLVTILIFSQYIEVILTTSYRERTSNKFLQKLQSKIFSLV